jgi:delta-1-pyrroline-5-carboxylate synthetase
MHRIAGNTDTLDKVLKATQLADDLILQEVTVPVGVLMVIIESRPDILPFVSPR